MPPSLIPSQSKIYQIRFKGHLGSQWSGWFEGFEITWGDKGVTRLTGPIVDDAELHGILKKIRDLGLPLLSVNRIESARKDPGEKD